MSEIKLLPCPFCGGEAEFCKGDWIGKEYWVKCTKCICKTSLSNNYNEPIRAWNTRKPMERIVERLKEVKSFYKDESEWSMAKYGAFTEAIDIVRNGGKE